MLSTQHKLRRPLTNTPCALTRQPAARTYLIVPDVDCWVDGWVAFRGGGV